MAFVHIVLSGACGADGETFENVSPSEPHRRGNIPECFPVAVAGLLGKQRVGMFPRYACAQKMFPRRAYRSDGETFFADVPAPALKCFPVGLAKSVSPLLLSIKCLIPG